MIPFAYREPRACHPLKTEWKMAGCLLYWYQESTGMLFRSLQANNSKHQRGGSSKHAGKPRGFRRPGRRGCGSMRRRGVASARRRGFQRPGPNLKAHVPFDCQGLHPQKFPVFRQVVLKSIHLLATSQCFLLEKLHWVKHREPCVGQGMSGKWLVRMVTRESHAQR